jgi:hypothetical protein
MKDEDIHKTHEESPVTYMTYIKGVQASHTFVKGFIEDPYTCWCCEKHVIKSGDHKPTATGQRTTQDNARRVWQKQHAGQRPGCPPFFRGLGAERFVPDLLHVNLRIVSNLYYYTAQV